MRFSYIHTFSTTLLISLATTLAVEASEIDLIKSTQNSKSVEVKSNLLGTNSQSVNLPEINSFDLPEAIKPNHLTQLPANGDLWEQINQYNNEGTALDQVNNVNQLRDVSPRDWAYEALRNLVETYGCIAGYPDGTFRGNRAMTRYEFAAGLNACLQQIERLIAASTADFVTKQDLFVLQRLMSEFETELASLGSRVDSLEGRTAFLEDHQFSTTTKLGGVVNFVTTGALAGDGDDQFTLQSRARLGFATSFTGKDLLITRIAAGNSTIPNLANGTDEVAQTNQWYGDFGNSFALVTLYYLFPVKDNLYVFLTPSGGLHSDYAFPALNPYFEDYNAGTTTLSNFAQRNAIQSLGGGSGVAFAYYLNDNISIGGGYYGGQAFRAEDGAGLFDGSYSTGTEVKWKPSDKFGVALSYIHSYFPEGQFGFGDNSRAFGLPPFLGTGVVNDTLAQFDTVTNAYGAEFFWHVADKFGVGGRFGFTDAQAFGQGDGEIWNYALTMAFPDLFSEGDLGGVIVGSQPYLGSLDGVDDFDNDTPVHVEAFYRHQLTDNISLTPGVLWFLAPNQDDDNDDIVLGTLRLTFTF